MLNTRKKSYFKRLGIINIVFFSFQFIILSRLMYLQVLQSNNFSTIASAQYTFTKKLPAHRGTIYDRNMKPLAVTFNSYSLYAEPEKIKNKQDTAKKISNLFMIPESVLMDKFSKKTPFVWILRQVSREMVDKMKEINIEGIGWIEEPKRFYPNNTLASNLIGTVGIDNKGLEGVELFYDDYLKGRDGICIGEKDARRILIKASDDKLIPVEDGSNIILTIDEIIQHIGEKYLDQTLKKHNAKRGTVIVMDPNNGDVLAMASRPTYNPNDLKNINIETMRNLAISFVYEPGSSFKPITISAALDKKIVTQTELFYCENGRYRIAGHILHDHKPYGDLTVAEIIKYSSNIGVSKIAEKLGKEKLYNSIISFGFGKKTGIDLPGEETGIFSNYKNWSKLSLVSIPMGQEIAVTPIQLISALNVIANGGMLVKPRIVKRIKNYRGRVIKAFPVEKKTRIISEETAKEMRKILEQVVVGGTGKNAKLKDYSAGGKTGTAQKIDKSSGKAIYSHKKFVSSFIGLAPVDKPMITILVVIDEPYPVYYGSQVAAPLFKKIAEETLNYLKR